MTKKKIYRELSKKCHPDLGGDGEVFKKINEAYNSNDIVELAEIYRNVTGTEVSIECNKNETIINISADEGESPFVIKKYSHESKRYPPTPQGVADHWSDTIVQRVSRIISIDSIWVYNLEMKVNIVWTKYINGKRYNQDAYLSGKYFDYETFAMAVMDAVDGSIKELQAPVHLMK